MSRVSRIQHPPGGRFFMIHQWLLDQFGKAPATVLGYLEFLDRAQDTPEAPLASATRIIVALEGFVGRDAVFKALDLLVEGGYLKRVEDVGMGDRNIERRVRYALCGGALSALAKQHQNTMEPAPAQEKFGTTDFSNSGNSGKSKAPKIQKNQESPELLKSGTPGTPEISTEIRSSPVYSKEDIKEQQQTKEEVNEETRAPERAVEENPKFVVVFFKDGTQIRLEKPSIRDDLVETVEAAYNSPNQPGKTMAAYAAGVARNWEAQGKVSSARAQAREKEKVREENCRTATARSEELEARAREELTRLKKQGQTALAWFCDQNPDQRRELTEKYKSSFAGRAILAALRITQHVDETVILNNPRLAKAFGDFLVPKLTGSKPAERGAVARSGAREYPTRHVA